MSDKVKCRKMTTAAFSALANKRADTLYFVNATGDFDPQSMNETDGDIYLGDKLLTEKPSPSAFPAYLPGPRVSIGALDPFGEYTPLESAYNANQQTRVDTDVTTYNDDVEFHIRFRQTQAGIYMRLFGADTGGSIRYRIGFVALSTTDITLCCRSTTGALTSAITRAKDHVYTLVGKLLNGSITLFVRDETTGETDLQTGTYDVDTGYAPPIRLFYISNQNAYQASGTHVYHAMLKVKGRTVLNYVPVLRKADGEVGFIDTVAGSFVAAASGTWLGGNPAAASAYVVAADPPDIPRFTYGGDETPPTPGLDGLVPSPTYGERFKYLRGDGTWQALPVPSVMSGATAQADGASGLVPQPLAGDNENFLSGDGTFRYPAAMFGRCATAAGTKAKTVTVSGPFRLVDGAVVFVRFANSNTISSPTLEVNGTDPKPIARYGTTAPGTSASLSWNSGSIQCLVYDGTNERWVLLGWINTTYADATQSAHGLLSVADKKKIDRLPASVVQPVFTADDIADWISYGSTGYLDAGAIGFTQGILSLDGYAANDHLELSVCLTAGNVSQSEMKHVLFSVLLMKEGEGGGDDVVVDTLASTMMTLPITPSGVKVVYNTATLNVAHKIAAADVDKHRSVYIRAEEISTSGGLSVRFYNTVNDYSSALRRHASAFTLKVWREVNL